MSKKYFFVLFFIFVFAAGLRLVHLSADSPATLHWGRAPFTDEGFYAHNARNKILFKSWSGDDFNYHFLSPVMSGINYCAFSFGGLRYRSIRVVSVAAGILTLLFLHLWLKKYFDNVTALIGVVLLGFNYFYCMHSRLALSEVPMLLSLTASFYFLTTADGKGSRLFLAGLCFALAMLTKALAGFFGLVAVYYIFTEKEKRGKNFVLFLLPIILTALGVFFLFIYADADAYFRAFKIFVGQRTPKHFFQIIKVFHTEFFAQMPVTTFLTLASLWFYKEFSPAEKKAAVWFWVGLLYLSLWSYTTAAYYLILIIPMVILSAVFIGKQSKEGEEKQSPAKGFRFFWFFCAYLLLRYMFVFYWRDFFFATKVTKVLLELTTLLAVLSLFLILQKKIVALTQQFKVLTIALFLTVDFSPYVLWAVYPRYFMERINRDIQHIVGKGTVAGPWAPALCLETNIREFPFWENVVNDKNLDTRTDFDFLLLERSYLELDFVKRVYPELLARGNIIRSYNFNSHIIDLWEFPRD